jgi:hypothetical protein
MFLLTTVGSACLKIRHRAELQIYSSHIGRFFYAAIQLFIISEMRQRYCIVVQLLLNVAAHQLKAVTMMP